MMSQWESVFQNSKILRSEKAFWMNQSCSMSSFWYFYVSCARYTNWVSLKQFGDDDLTKWCLNFKILRKKFQKRIPHLKVHLTFDFHLSNTISTWDTNLGVFWCSCELMISPQESKLQYFEKVISEVNSSLQSSIKLRFWSFYQP